MPVHNGKSFIDNIIYTGPKIVEHTGQILCVEEEKTVTFDGTSFNTVMVPIVYPTPSPTPGVDYGTEMRQEWMSENFNLPMAKDLILANLTTNELRGRFERWDYGTNDVFYDLYNVYPNSKWRDYFLSDQPVSVEIGNGQRVYNNAAINYIDNRYKTMGWRVPLWEDYKHLSLFWNFGDGVKNIALPSAMAQRFPKLRSGTMGITYGASMHAISDTLKNVGGHLTRAYPSMTVSGGSYCGREYKIDDSPSAWVEDSDTTAKYYWYYASRAINYDSSSTPRGGWIDYDWGDRKTTSVWITRAINEDMGKIPQNPSPSVNPRQDMRGAIVSSDSLSNGSLIGTEGKVSIKIGIAYAGAIDPNADARLKAPWFYSVRLCKNVRVSPVIPPWL